MDDQFSQPVGHGHRLLGNYRILQLLGQGGFADVYLAEHIHLRTQAAIKVLQVRLVENNIQSFLNEARTIAHLVHPYIIRVLDFGVEANTPFLVMDYAPKGTFRQRFLQGMPLPATLLFPYIKQAASALQYAHDRKLIHRDVKPENMLLGPNEEVLLSDFGFALMQSSISRSPSETAGTASYMSPEQLQGKPQPASDQYALGIIAYEWLTGACPFQGTFFEIASQHMLAQPPSIRQRVPDLSPEVEQVVMAALVKDPGRRFPSVTDFALALEHACLASTHKSLSFNSPIAPSPFFASTSAPGLNSGHFLSSNPGNSLLHFQNSQNAQPPLNPISQQQMHTDFENPFKFSEHSSPFPASQHSSSSAFTPNPVSPEQSAQSFQAWEQAQTLHHKSFSSSTPFPQNMSDIAKPSQSGYWPLPFTSTDQPIRSNPFENERGTSNRPETPPSERLSQAGLSPLPSQHKAFESEGGASNRPETPPSERLSQAGLSPLSSQPRAQDKNTLTNNPISSSLQSWLPTSSYGSQTSMTPLPRGHVSLPGLRSTSSLSGIGLSPESSSTAALGKQNWQTPGGSQTFPVSQNTSTSMFPPSPRSNVLDGLPPLDIDPLVKGPSTMFSEEQPVFLASDQPSISPLISSSSLPLTGTPSGGREAKRFRSRALSIFVIAMVILIIGSTTILISMTNNQTNNNPANNIPANQQQRVSNGRTTTGPKQSSQQATATQLAQNPYGNHNGVLVLNSPLSQQDQQVQWADSPATCAFSDGAYHVIAGAQSQGFTMCDATTSDYANFVYQVQMTFAKTTATASSGGLVFRANNTTHQFYFFEIFVTGSYAFYRCPGTNGGPCPVLSSSATTGIASIATFHTALNQPNIIAIEATGNTFNIYVNNQLVIGPVTDTITDPNFSHGMIGMMARQGNANSTTDVFFNDVKLWKF